MGRRGGGAWGACGGGCAVLAAALVVSALVIRGAGGPKHSHAPAFARKVLLSITSGHQQNNLGTILHPSQLQAPRLQSLGLAAKPSAPTSTHANKQQDRYAQSPTTKHEDEAVSPSKQAVLPTMQPSASPDHFYQPPNIEIPPSIQSPGPIVGQAAPPSQMISPSIQTGNPHIQKQVPAASPSLPVEPHVPDPKIAVNTPAAAPSFQQPPWSSQPLPSPPSTGSQSTQPAHSPRINAHSPPSSHTPTGQDTSRVPVASPPAELPSQRKPPPKAAVPPTPITPASSQDKDGISAARPPNNLPRHNSSPPKAIFPPIDSNRDNIPAAPPSMHGAIQIPPQQGQSSHSNVSAVSPSPITSPAVHWTRYGALVPAPPEQSSSPSPPAHYPHIGGSSTSPPLNAPRTNQGKMYGIRVASHPKHLPPLNYPHKKRPAVPPVSTNSPPVLVPPIRSYPPLPANKPQVQRPAASPATTIHPANHGKAHGAPVAAPSKGRHRHSMHVHNTHGKIHGAPVVAPSKGRHHHSLPVNNTYVKGPAVSPSNSPSIHRRGHGIPVAAPPKEHSSHLPPGNHSHHKGSYPVVSPAPHRADNASATSHGHFGLHHSPTPASVGLPPSEGNPAYAPHHPRHYHSPSYSPEPALPHMHPPDSPAFKKPKALAPAPSQSLPPPPPNSYCTSLSCQDPLTNSPPGTTCLCVLPIKVELRLGIALYTFFALVLELAQEISSGVLMKQSQVRVMGANAATEDPEKTIVLIDLVPLGAKFDNTTALLVFERFWHKQVIINPMHFGNYDVLYVLYPGLPSSPPTAPGSMNNGLSNVNDFRLRPLAVDVGSHRERKGRGIIIIVVLSGVFAFILCAGAALVIYFKLRNRNHLTEASLTPAKPAGPGSVVIGSRLGSRPISASPSFSSSIVTYKGSAKTFSLVEMERATQRFDESRIIGEGGFGRVYEGILEDGERVAVKILKRDDQQGTREFLAEVEMLSRLHHRNLVKLIGICTEEHIRCLVYEIVPNGSVESHLHGSDKETAPLDWDARLKIALGAARALAYLHEDSSPRVIHRDFKSSNILLEHDFTPKVSDFGLARTALGEGNEHISTRVMGTFGYVAPEYAMTGHLLVKSDVYSYGVVLLELLTGRKPVDMSRPPGQENLVAWARPLLTSRDGLETIIDPSLGSSIPFDSIAKVAAIASMCVQPEVDQRPFMGEVVQALKLVCNEGSEFNESRSFSQDLHIQDAEIISRASLDMHGDPVLSAELFVASARHDTLDASGSFRRYSSSGPLRVGRTGHNRERGVSTGSSSEHGGLQRFRIDSG